MNKDQSAIAAVENIIKNGCSDITKENIELLIINNNKEKYIEYIKKELNKTTVFDMNIKPIAHLLTPKGRYIFDNRKAAILDPTSNAIFLGVILQYAEIIEKHRIPTEKNIVFSYRFKIDNGNIFDKNINYSAWRETNKKKALSGEYKYIVETDIAGFYDRINIHRIESILESINVPSNLKRITNDILLFWSKKDSYGLPVGNNASRILAEAALIDIDQYLLNENIIFTRFVDDYRFFTTDLLSAQRALNKLSMRLFRDGLILNTQKTIIRKVVDEKSDEKNNSTDLEANKVLKEVTKLVGGYNKIVKKFILPSQEKQKIFLEENLDLLFANLAHNNIATFEEIQKIIISTLIQQKYHEIIKICQIVKDNLFALDYFIDMLIKNSAYISNEIKSQITSFFQHLIFSKELLNFDWQCALIAKLLSHNDFLSKESLIFIFRETNKETSTYAASVALEGLKTKINRSEFRTIREYFYRCDDWEKRRLIHLADSLPEEERKAWGKAIKSTLSDDYFSEYLVDKFLITQSFTAAPALAPTV